MHVSRFHLGPMGLLLCFVSALALSVSVADTPSADTKASQARPSSQLSVKGVDKTLAAAISGYLSPVNERRYRSWKNRAPERVKTALQAFGYYNSQVSVNETQQDGVRNIVVSVDRGPVTQVSRLTLEVTGDGENDSRFSALRKRFPLQLGSVLVHSDYESGKRAFFDTASAFGYFDATFTTHQVRVDTATNTAQITLVFDTGKRYQIGAIRFTSEVLDHDFLRSWVPFTEGSDYQASSLVQLSKDLRKSGYFDRVRVSTQHEEASDGVVPLQIETQPRSRYVGRVGGGYATDVGFRGSVRVERPYINRWGHSIASELSLSAPQQSFSLQYKVPRKPDPANHYLNFSTGFQREDSDERYFEMTQAAAELHDISERGWRRTQALRWQRERFRIADNTETTTLWMPSVSLRRTRSVGGLYPTKGEQYNIELNGAGQAVGSDIDLLRAKASGKWLRTLAPKHTLLTRLDLGWISTNNFDLVPVSLRFFAGGDKSIRGFSYNEITPVNSEGQETGGDHLLVYSAEYQYQINDSWAAAAFADSGKAFFDWQAPDRTGVGLGVRWRSPVGPVRLDLGFPVSEDEITPKLHFSIGPAL